MYSLRHLFMLLPILALFSLSTSAEIVIVADTESSHEISEISSLSFDGDFSSGSLVVNYKDGTRSTLPIAKVSKVLFTADDVASTVSELCSPLSVAVRGDVLLLTAEGGSVDIFDISGARHLSQSLANGVNVVRLHDLPKGVYIVRANGRQFKFYKK